MRRLLTRASWTMFGVMLGGCAPTYGADAPSDEDARGTTSALTADQCMYYASSGATQICHYTGAARHPFTVLRTSEAACVNAHANHDHDYVAVGDPTCSGGGCLPESAPCDAFLPCCDGFACSNGTCKSVCAAGEVLCPDGNRCSDLTSDPTNCGACGNACSTGPNANARCAAGACGFTCAAGWADCDGDPRNGCEVPLDGSTFRIETIDFPGAVNTYAKAINSRGDIAGEYQTEDWQVLHGFVLHDGVFSTIDRPGASWMNVTAIDENGRVLGYTSSENAEHPFVFANGAFTPISELDGASYIPKGWNSMGDVVGVSGQRGFLMRNGVITDIVDPGKYYTRLAGISEDGAVIVGYSFDAGAETNARSFFLQNGAFSAITYSAAADTEVSGISAGRVVGTVMMPSFERKTFVYESGAFKIVSPPSFFTSGMYGYGINAKGQVVGAVDHNAGAFYISGFLATPRTQSCAGP